MVRPDWFLCDLGANHYSKHAYRAGQLTPAVSQGNAIFQNGDQPFANAEFGMWISE
jgi:hypothetical protein